MNVTIPILFFNNNDTDRERSGTQQILLSLYLVVVESVSVFQV